MGEIREKILVIVSQRAPTLLPYGEAHGRGRRMPVRESAAPKPARLSRLFAVWPGEWSSHLFMIDDLDEYAKAQKIKHDQNRTGLEEHVHDMEWTEATGRNLSPRSPYISIRLTLTCGCEIRDLGTFASQMQEQRGWAIATSVGWGSSSGPDGTSYSLRVRRKSLGI